MNLKLRRNIAATAFTALLLAGLFLWYANPYRDATEDQAANANILPGASGTDQVIDAPEVYWSPEVEKEVLATRMMYLAHAPLREPSIDDPDSPENMRIAQQMILKTLQRTDSVSPAIP